MPACFVCKRTGEKICDGEEAEIRCTVCGRCEAERLKEVDDAEPD